MREMKLNIPNPTATDAGGARYIATCRPKPSCRRCYGRGFIGTNDKGEVVICTCVIRKVEQVEKEVEDELG